MARKATGTPRTDKEPQKDVLSQSVSLKAHIDQSGLTLSGKSRTLAAIDRLVGGCFGWFAEFVEGKRLNRQILEEGRNALSRLQFEAAIKKLEGMDTAGDAILASFMRDQEIKFENKSSIAYLAFEEIIREPTENPSVNVSPEQAESENIKLDEDWLNSFTSYAEQASSVRLREMWAQVLAGEIRRPESFARTTLRVMAEMDKDVAASFQEIYCYSVAGYIARPEPFSGEVLEQFARLEQYGLVQTSFGLSLTVNANTDGIGQFSGSTHALRVTFKSGQKEVVFPVIMITRVGRQIGTILSGDEPEALRRIGRELVTVEKVELCQQVVVDGTHMLRFIEVLHQV